MADAVATLEPTTTTTTTTDQPTTGGNGNPPPTVTDQKSEGQQPAAAPAPEPLDPEYIARGGRWKLGEDDLRSVPRDVFERMHVAAEAELLENLHRARQGQNGQQPYQPPPQQNWQQPQGQNGQQSQQPVGPYKPVELKFDESDADSPYVQHISTINKAYAENLNAMHGQFSDQVRQIVDAVKALHEFNDSQVLDRNISELGEEWSDVFGKGATMDLDPRSQSYAARQAYKKAILENLDLDASLGRERNPSDAMQRARYRLHGTKIAAIERAKREAKAKEAAKTLPAPTGATNGRASNNGRENDMRIAREIMGKR